MSTACSAVALAIISIVFIAGCTQQDQQANTPEPQAKLIDRESKIPADSVKITEEMDASPPKSYSPDYKDPVPLPYPINTAGAEDSAFIMPDGNTLYLFFTPDVRVPVEKQIIDGVTGIYVSRKTNGQWSKPERILLQDPGKISGDGCEFVLGNKMWFCSVREGYTGINWFTAEFVDGRWSNWKSAGFSASYEVGELHIYGDELYYHSSRAGGKGGLDIWVLRKIDGMWQEPINIEAVNTADNEGWPAITPDGEEMWFLRNYGLWRSTKTNNEWGEPEQMFFPLAGEASIDSDGNVYFTHHFYNNNTMIEADIYVAHKNE